MQSINELLTTLRHSGVSLRLIGNDLEVNVPEEGLSDKLYQQLKDSKQEIVAYLRSLGREDQQYTDIPLAAKMSDYPLSFSQYRVWLTTELEKNTNAYNIPFAIELTGQLQIPHLFEAIKKVVERHEILRTVFRKNETGLIRQVILDASFLHVKPEFSDISQYADKDSYIKQVVESSGNREFDLSVGPLWHVHFIKRQEDNYLLVFNIHHAICDGWSIQILMRDMVAYYHAFTENVLPGIPELAIQYKDFAVWQQQQLEGEQLEKLRSFWRGTLQNLPGALDLRTENNRPAYKTYSGNTIHFDVSRLLYEQIKTRIRSREVSLFMFLLSVVKGILFRYTQQNDLIVGTPVAGRDHASLNDQVGFYVNTIPLRTRCNGDESFASLLNTVKNNVLQAMNHQHYPLDMLIDELNIKRDVSRSALFDILVVVQNASAATNGMVQNGKWKAAWMDVEHKSTKFDITFTFKETAAQLGFAIYYNTDIYNGSFIARLGDHVIRFMDAVIANEQAVVNTIDYFTQKERLHLLNYINNTARPFPEKETIVTVFAQQVKRVPENRALVCGDSQFTYRELNRITNQFQAFLQATYNIVKGNVVGIMLPRSEWIMISILGILKSGAVFLPLDQDEPDERKSAIIASSGCKQIITEEVIAAFIEHIKDYADAGNQVDIEPDDAAYMIFTSGTTGVPKGVVTSHRNIINYHYWFKNAFQISEKDSSVLLSNIVFSGVYTSVYCTILNGGSLHIIPKLMLHNAEELATYVNQNGISFLKITPSHLDMLVNYGHLLSFLTDQLRLIVIGGDRIKGNNLGRFFEKNKNIRLIYHFGSTETTMGALTYEIKPENLVAFNKRSKVGRPIDNVSVYLLDQNNQLVPKGLVGEICIAGANICSGYYNNEKLTEDKFIRLPFHPHVRVYKTGDVGRLLEDDQVELIGRSDNQVKIRGFRIELGEIENTLLAHEGIRGAVVLPVSTATVDTDLVAYIVSDREQQVKSLRDYLKKKLPEFMIPSWFVQMDGFPLSITGKIDTKAFPSPYESHMETGVEFVEAQTLIEKKVLSIWKEILGKKNISIKDDFFELGGHSLKFALAINRYFREFHTKLSMAAAFVQPTIENHALLIERSSKTKYANIEQTTLQDRYPLSNAQRRLWTSSQLTSASTALNIPVAYTITGDIDKATLEQSLRTLICRHEVLRTYFKAENDEVWQFIIPERELFFALQYEDLRGIHIENRNKLVQAAIVQERSVVFRLDKAPLIRVKLFQIGDQEYVFSIVMHHIISDGWSMHILIRELKEVYNRLKKKETETLLPLKLQYKDYAAWQRYLLDNNLLEEHKEYWRQQLIEPLPTLDLQPHLKRPPLLSYNGAEVKATISAELVSNFEQFLQRNNCTLYMGLTAVSYLVLHYFSHQDDIIIGAPFAGRQHPDLEDQVGFYVNLLPLRLQFNADDSFESVLKRVKKILVAANEYQLYPLDELVSELNTKRDISRGVLYDVVVSFMENHLSQSSQEMVFDGFTLTGYRDVHIFKSRFDLLFNFSISGKKLQMNLNYNIDLFPEEFVKEIQDCFERILSTVVVQPSLQLSELLYVKDLLPHTGKASADTPDLNITEDFFDLNNFLNT